MNTLPEIASLWIGERLSWLEQICLLSFVRAGHKISLYSYQPLANVPAGIEMLAAADIFPEYPTWRFDSGSPAPHSDLFRLNLLAKTNKLWVDTDIFCLKPFDFDNPMIFGMEDGHYANSAVLRLPHDSATLLDMLAFFQDEYAIAPFSRFQTNKHNWRLQASLKIRYALGLKTLPFMIKHHWGYAGPKALTWFLNKTGEIDQAQAVEVFYPIHWRDFYRFAVPDAQLDFGDKTYCVHLYGKKIRQELVKKYTGMPPAGSFLFEMAKKLNVAPEDAPIADTVSLKRN